MADTMQFDLVSPERKLVSGEATSVQIPGMNGDMSAMPDHAAFLTTLRPGVVKVYNGAEVSEYVVTGGFAEISEKGTSILAERALPRAEVNAEVLSEILQDAEKALELAVEETERTAAALRVNDVKALQEHLS